MSRNFYIDCQVFQTEAWHRGMGKYSISLLRSVSSEILNRYEKVHLVFNNSLPIEKQVVDELQSIFPESVMNQIDLKNPEPHVALRKTKIQNKKILDANIESNSDYLIPALFIDEACIVFPNKINKKLLIFYDLIPFLYFNRYKNRINYDNYLDHFSSVFEADILYCISQTVSDDNAVYLGLDDKKLVTIDGASIDRSKNKSRKPKLDLDNNKFILMPTGDEVRKNNLRGAQGFKIFNELHDNEQKLVITSRVSDHTKEELLKISDSIIFSGNVDEEELQWLYENSTLVMFPPEYEGLGLPILEAMSVNKKIVCSDIPVFREISTDALYYFNHLDPHSIASGLEFAFSDVNFEHKSILYKDILKEYSWENTAKKFFEGLDRNKKETKSIKKPRVAVLTPDPSGFSAIGKVVAETHDAMSSYFDIDYYYDKGAYHQEVRPEFLSHVANTFEAKEFNAKVYADYDAIFYHIGNSDYHLETIKNALHLPGIAIMHDTFLVGAYTGLLNVGYISKERADVEKELSVSKDKLSEYLYSLVTNQVGTVLHSKYAENAVKEDTNNDATEVVNLAVSVPKLNKTRSKNFHIGLAGIIADVKGLQIIEEVASSELFEGNQISIFGHSFAKPEVMKEFEKWPHVSVYPDPTDLEFQTKLSGIDALINYRMEYRGETSLTTLEAMRYGVPVIVRDIGWYSELPSHSVVKAKSVHDVIDALVELKDNQSLWNEISKNSKDYVSEYHTHDQYVKGLLDSLEIKDKAPKDALKLQKALKNHSSLSEIIQLLD